MKFHLTKLTCLVAVLLLYVPGVWSQAFYTEVIGFATACGTKKPYSQTEPRSTAGQAMSVCKTAFATGQSKADIDLGSDGGVVVAGGSAGASSETVDTVTLTPPPGFNGTSVPVTLKDIYSAGFQGSGGTVKMCWLVPNLVNLCVTMTTNGGGKINKQFTLPKSPSVFKFEISKIMHAVGSSSSKKNAISADYVTTGDPTISLPVGWTCTYASGNKCGPL